MLIINYQFIDLFTYKNYFAAEEEKSGNFFLQNNNRPRQLGFYGITIPNWRYE